MAKSIMVEILGNASQFKGELAGAVASTEKANSSFVKMGKVAGVAGLAIAGGLAYGLEKSVKAALAAQTSTARLDAGFKAAGLTATNYAGQIAGAESAGRKLGFTNTDVRDSLGSLMVASKNTGKAITDLGVAEDIARFKHVDLADASKMLTMAMTGSQRAAKQLGIIVPSVSSALDALKAAHSSLITTLHKHGAATVKLVEDHAFFQTALGKTLEAQAKVQDKMATGNAIIDEVSKRVHGQGAAFADTAAGGMAQFHAQTTALMESLGTLLLPAVKAVATALADLAGYLTKHKALAEALVIGLGGLAAALIGVSVATQLANLAFLASPFGAVLAGLVLLGAGIYELITHWHQVTAVMGNVWDYIENTFLGAWHDTLGAIKTVYNWVSANWPLILGILTGPIGLAVEQIAAHWSTIQSDAVGAWNTIKGFFERTVGEIAHFFTALPGKIIDAISSTIGVLESGLKDLFSWKKIVGWIKDALGFGSPSPHFMAIGADIVDSMARGVGAAAGVLKSAVEKIAMDVLNTVNPFGGGSHSGGPGAAVLGGKAGGTTSGGLVPQVTEALSFARSHGWHGVVTSGWRSYAEQAALYQKYLHGGPLAAPPGTSSHERGEAVDVTDYQQFGAIMAIAPGFERLYNRLGARDPVHFSVTGYAGGGTVPGPIGQPQVAIVHGGETISPPGASGVTVNLYVGGSVITEGQLVDKVRREFLRIQKRNVGLGFT